MKVQVYSGIRQEGHTAPPPRSRSSFRSQGLFRRSSGMPRETTSKALAFRVGVDLGRAIVPIVITAKKKPSAMVLFFLSFPTSAVFH
mmetsp:Transcript_26721/g.37280  ORF Transcript_26721/g.37280 Transcript_26721/m.37280 type:complete len:87 (+) Transcript_26721:504-764(+)